jgi:hypothetical protein
MVGGLASVGIGVVAFVWLRRIRGRDRAYPAGISDTAPVDLAAR